MMLRKVGVVGVAGTVLNALIDLGRKVQGIRSQKSSLEILPD